MVSLHDGTKQGGKSIGYGQSAVLKNVDFVSSEKGALNIARGKTGKATIGRIHGDYDDVPVETVYNKVKKELTNPNSEYVQVGMNPFRHSYFYDKATGTPILKADEILQIGPLVLAKKPIYGKAADFSFKEGGMINMENGGMLGGDLPPEAIANGNVIQGAPVGEVAVPGGGGPTDDGVPTSLPEGTFVLNAASVEYHGTKHINDLIKKSIRNLVKKGVQISGEDLNPDDDVPVAISNGEYIIPPEVSRDIGIKKLEDMNERGLEYRKRIQEQEKQKMAAQDRAMQSFMGAPIQSEQQMPMQDGGEASPPDEAMPKPPEEDTSGLTEGQKAVIEAELLKRRLQQEFFNRESERQRRLMEQEERDKGMIFNEKTGQFDLMAQADKPVVPAVPVDRNIMQGQPKQDYMDKLIQQSMKARGMAQIGGTIERDPQSTFLVPQIVRQAQGLPQGANTFPTSPQEPFIGGIPTGSVLENISNAMPQSLQPTGFMQPMDQKKSPEIARFSFQDGTRVPLKKPTDAFDNTEGAKYFSDIFADEGFIPIAKRLEFVNAKTGKKEKEKFATQGFGDYGPHVVEGDKINKDIARQNAIVAINEILVRIRKNIPNFDNFSDRLKKRVVNAWYRGSLSQSPNTIALLKSNQFKEASKEFLNFQEYKDAKAGLTKKGGIVPRMEETSRAMAEEEVARK